MHITIAVLSGDGVGPEVVRAARSVLDAVASIYSHTIDYKDAPIGGYAIDLCGDPFPQDTQHVCETADAILFGAIGDPKFDNNPKATVRPEQGLLRMRKTLGLYANVRPINVFPELYGASPLRADIITDVDFIVIRELIGGIYFGEPRGRSENGTSAFDTCVYHAHEVERVLTYAYTLSQSRKKRLTVVDKANVLATSRLWREVSQSLTSRYPEVQVEYMFVDNAAMQIIRNPRAFDVIVTENMFGDILTDEASVLCGSLGMLPSASIGTKTALYEPIHGSYPQATGKDIANPIGTILSVAMMLQQSFALNREAESIVHAVRHTLAQGYGTPDLSPTQVLGTQAYAHKIVEEIYRITL